MKICLLNAHLFAPHDSKSVGKEDANESFDAKKLLDLSDVELIQFADELEDYDLGEMHRKFENIAKILEQRKDKRVETRIGEKYNHFLCPISSSLIKDPVQAADDFTYDRQNIERWFQKSSKSPMTNLPISKHLSINQFAKQSLEDAMAEETKKFSTVPAGSRKRKRREEARAEED